MERRPTPEFAPVITRMPPGKDLARTVLPLSRCLAGATSLANSGLSSISGAMRCCETFLAVSTVGHTPITGAGLQCMMNPSQLFPASVAPTCAAFMNTTRRAGCVGESASITSRRNGVRLVR